jgi:Flp pilus assembly protein TadD
VAAAVYLGTLGNAPVLDDGWVIFENPLVRSLSNLPRILREPYGFGGPTTTGGVYRPLTTLSYALNYAAGGRAVGGYHAVSLLLHVLCTLAVLSLARRVFAAVAPSRARPAGLLAALLFAVHPVHVEAVAALTGRAELLAALGALASLQLAATRAAGLWRLPAALGAVLLGTLSKENAAATPLLFAILGVAVPSAAGLSSRPGLRSREGRRALAALLAVSTALAAAAAAYLVLRPGTGGPGVPMASRWFGAQPRGVVLGTMSRALLEYLRLLAVPHPLGVDFFYASRIPFMPWWSATALWSALACGSVLALGLSSLRRAPVRALGILWVFAALLPVSNAVPTGVLMAERLLYLPSVGFCLWAGHGLAWAREAAARRWPGRVGRARAIGAATTLALLALAGKTVQRGLEWRDARTLWEAELRKAPLDPVVNNNLAVQYTARGDLARARERLEVALRAAPAYWRAWVNLGIVEHRSDRIDLALGHFARAQRIDPSAPDPPFFAALALADRGDPKEAVELLARAERLAPEDPRARLWRGRLLARLGRLEEARSELARAAELDPADGQARTELANLGEGDPAPGHEGAAGGVPGRPGRAGDRIPP